MAESSFGWTTNGTGDGPAGGYPADALLRVFRALFTRDPSVQGYLRDVGGQLAVTGSHTSTGVSVASGAAIVAGLFYHNPATIAVPVPAPLNATRRDRLVLRANASAQTVRVTRLAGTEGGATAPSLTQSANFPASGTHWDIPLAMLTVEPTGIITITDERQACRFNTLAAAADNQTVEYSGDMLRVKDLGITENKLAAGAVSSAKIATSAVIEGKIANAAVTTVKITDGSVTTPKLADAAVTTAKIADGSVTGAKLGAGIVRAQSGAPRKMLYGTATVGASGANVTFPEPFGTPPLVFAAANVVGAVSSITTTGFYISNPGGAPYTLSYIAVGGA